MTTGEGRASLNNAGLSHVLNGPHESGNLPSASATRSLFPDHHARRATTGNRPNLPMERLHRTDMSRSRDMPSVVIGPVWTCLFAGGSNAQVSAINVTGAVSCFTCLEDIIRVSRLVVPRALAHHRYFILFFFRPASKILITDDMRLLAELATLSAASVFSTVICSYARSYVNWKPYA